MFGSLGNSGASVLAAGSSPKNEENERPRPPAIFHRVAMVGTDSCRSICPSMALDTCVAPATASRLNSLSLRYAFSLLAMVSL